MEENLKAPLWTNVQTHSNRRPTALFHLERLASAAAAPPVATADEAGIVLGGLSCPGDGLPDFDG